MITLTLGQITSFVKVRRDSPAYTSVEFPLADVFLQDLSSNPNPLWLLYHRDQIVDSLLLQPSLPVSDLLYGFPHHWDSFHPMVDGLDAHRFPPLPSLHL